MEELKTNKADMLAEVAEAIVAGDTTPHLKATATQLVFGAGNPDAEIVFVGEAPGKHEDLKGEPFVGAAGKFLDEMLASIGLKRPNVYITNIVKYRPPENRDPTPEEIQEFIPFLQRQLAVIRPKLIVLLGRHSMSVFLPELKISQVHGKPYRRLGHVYLPLFHPAAALYNGGMRQTLLDDFSLIPAIIKKID
jgi:uracil-DNA glycosylase family 4